MPSTSNYGFVNFSFDDLIPMNNNLNECVPQNFDMNLIKRTHISMMAPITHEPMICPK